MDSSTDSKSSTMMYIKVFGIVIVCFVVFYYINRYFDDQRYQAIDEYAKASTLANYTKASDLANYTKASDLAIYAKQTDLSKYLATDMLSQEMNKAMATRVRSFQGALNMTRISQTTVIVTPFFNNQAAFIPSCISVSPGGGMIVIHGSQKFIDALMNYKDTDPVGNFYTAGLKVIQTLMKVESFRFRRRQEDPPVAVEAQMKPCTEGPGPKGSYQNSCFNCQLDNDVLTATCKDRVYNDNSTVFYNPSTCFGDIMNNNGRLECSTDLLWSLSSTVDQLQSQLSSPNNRQDLILRQLSKKAEEVMMSSMSAYRNLNKNDTDIMADWTLSSQFSNKYVYRISYDGEGNIEIVSGLDSSTVVQPDSPVYREIIKDLLLYNPGLLTPC